MTLSERISQVQDLIRGWTNRRDEQRILTMLRDCPDAELDAVLQGLNLRSLVRNLHNRVGGPDFRTELVHVLTVERIDHLSLDTRVKLVWAMQRGTTRRVFEVAIRNIILASTGNDLRKLRNELNLSDSHRDLPRLIFKDIDDPAIRREILDHIQEHQVQTNKVKVLSDIDDTVFARLHDKRYPGKTRYPGVLAFFAALNHSEGKQSSDSNITFVTARPGFFAGIVSAITRRTLRKAGILRPTILTGNLLSLRSHKSMAAAKIANIRQYHQVFPEYGLVFVGDSGQGDIDVGRLMRQEFPHAVRAVLIHDINETALHMPPARKEPGIEFFDTYIAAAALAWQHELITHTQALEVGDAALTELRDMKVITPQQRQDRLAEHLQDQQSLLKGDTGPDTGKQ